MGLAFLVPGLAFLVWVAPLPWLLAAAEGRRVFLAAYMGGILYVLVGCAWLLKVGLVPWFANALFFGLYVAATLWALTRCRAAFRLPFWLLAPVVVGGGEVLRMVACPFPTTVLALGDLLVGARVLRQTAEVTWVFGLSLLPLLVAGTCADGLLAWHREGRKGLLARRVLVGAGVSAAALMGCWVYGAWRLSHVVLTEGPSVALVQPAIPQSMKSRPENRMEVLRRHAVLTVSVDLGRADLVIWPESAATIYLEQEPGVMRNLAALTARTGRPLLMGASGTRRRADGDEDPTNSAFLIDTRGRIAGRWDKRQLVPLAETLLIVDRIPPLRRWLGGWLADRFSFYPFLVPGKRAVAVRVPGADWLVGATICYGDILPPLTRDLKEAGADVIAVLSNEAWFGNTHLHQHLALARLRAIETRLPVVRATNTGVTAVIDPDGEVRAALAIDKRGVLVERVRQTKLEPPPAWVPTWFGRLLLLGAIALLSATFLPAWRPGRRSVS